MKNSLFYTYLCSALRTAVACTIIACTALYSSTTIRHLFAFPAFSYVTTILIVSDSTLGDTLRGSCHALYATIQVIIPSTMALYIIPPAKLTNGVIATMVAVASFFVAFPKSTPLMTKRIAFGQIVILFVGAVVRGEKVFMLSLQVTLSTVLGVTASVLAMLIPFPKLACTEVRRIGGLYGDDASERFNLLVEAFSAKDSDTATTLISQANFIANAGFKHLRSIKHHRSGMLWEKPKFFLRNRNGIEENLQEMEILMRGMDIALSSGVSFPVEVLDEELRDVLKSMNTKMSLKIKDLTTTVEIKREMSEKPFMISKITSISHEDLPSFFFLYCIKLLLEDDLDINQTRDIDEKHTSSSKAEAHSIIEWLASSPILKVSNERFLFAAKCSLSLGLAVLCGLIYEKKNAFWSGLTIAISFAAKRQPTFTMANARLQGTAIGSVYGLLSVITFGRFMHLRFLPMLPWVIFASFIRHSRMYGEAGAISAAIGALLILGRRNYEAPREFAIARITEASIGLICFILVHILFEPTRAATLAKSALSRTFGELQNCIEEITICTSEKDNLVCKSQAMMEKHKRLKYHVEELEKYINEAKLEPNFWFLPFHCDSYGKLLGSISQMVDLLQFAFCEIRLICLESQKFGITSEEILQNVNDDIKIFEDKVGLALKRFKGVVSIQSLSDVGNALKQSNLPHDIELGKQQPVANVTKLSPDEDEVEEIIRSFLGQVISLASRNHDNDEQENAKNQLVLSLNALGFCISRLMRQTREIENELDELVRWECRNRYISVYHISSKIIAQCKT